MNLFDKMKNATKKYLIEMQTIFYWEKVNTKFKRKAKEKVVYFTMSFKHKNIFFPICYDDEFKIEAIAKKYGYVIKGESLSKNYSVYSFKKEKSS